MSFLAPDALNLIQDLLAHITEESSTPFFASPDSADYFRKKIREKPTAPLPPIQTEWVHPIPIKREMPSVPSAKGVEREPNPTQLLPPVPPPIKKKDDSKPVFVLEDRPVEIPQKEGKTQSAKGSTSFEDVRKIFVKIAPEFPILDEIPNDALAHKIAQRWKTKNQTAPISILSLHEPPQQKALLEQIAKAIDIVFGPARLIQAEPIEKDKQWEAFLSVPELKITIACDYTLWQLNGLMSFYKENPTQGTRTLGEVPLFLLPDLSLYLKDPLLKRSLWKALCQKLSS